MRFAQALDMMKHGIPMKLPSWGGYWCWDGDAETIIMYTKDNHRMDIRETQRVEYTLLNVLSDEWTPADGKNCPILGGTAQFGFSEAIRYLKRGMRVPGRDGMGSVSILNWHPISVTPCLMVKSRIRIMTRSVIKRLHLSERREYSLDGLHHRRICWLKTGCLWNRTGE